VSTLSVDVAAEPDIDRENPYVGPRAFRTSEKLYAREQEAHELTNLLIAERIVLLHAPSGAGKTSLIRAGLKPLLERRGFRSTAPLRVNTPPPANGAVPNRYIYSVAASLLGDERDPHDLAQLTFDAVVKSAVREAGDDFVVLVFDQFEEILTVDPTDWTNQAIFFKELGKTLAYSEEDSAAGPPVWALLSMREDFIGGLDRFLCYLPGHLQTTYRLDFLHQTAAKIAIQAPARDRRVEFTDDAATELVRRLARVKITTPRQEGSDTEYEFVEAPYVQPFQLQVVCRRLWHTLSKEKRDGFRSIELEDVERHTDISKALRRYYAGAVAEVAQQTGAEEMEIRQWFENQLIREGVRSQTMLAPESGDQADVLRALQDAYLIRGDTRADSTWYELAHDMLVGPILDDNRKWRRSRLEPWQLAAREWQADRQMGRLLVGPDLRDAHRHAKDMKLEPFERDFLNESDRVERERGFRVRMREVLSIVSMFALAEAAVIVALALLLFAR
jgi:hypothetical protein